MTALTLRPVTYDDLGALFALKVAKGQEGQVAPNEITLAQQAYDRVGTHVWALATGDTIVGLMAMIDCSNYPELEDGDDPNAAHIWRLMVGADHQRKGHGRAAIALAEAKTREWGLPTLNLTFVDKTGGAEGFYRACGFTRTGRVVDGEVEMAKPV